MLQGTDIGDVLH